jgi:hypothetical protein
MIAPRVVEKIVAASRRFGRRVLHRVYCDHAQSQVIIWNPTLPKGQMIAVSWCSTCGAVKRSLGIPDGSGNFVYTWCGSPPTWELPDQARGVGEHLS